MNMVWMCRTALRSMVLALCCVVGPLAWSQAKSWPSRPVTLIVPFVPGGASDKVARLLAPEFSAVIGQPVLVKNLAGAGGSIAARQLTRLEPDGYVLMFAGPSETVLIPLNQPAVGYSPQDLQPISIVGSTPLALAVPTNFPAKDIDDWVRITRTKPMKFSFGSTGIGSFGHLVMGALVHQLGLDVLHVPYKGSSQLLNDLAGGQIELAVTSLASALPYANSEKIKLIGISSPTRLEEISQTPTFHESITLANSQISIWGGVFAPKGVPDLIAVKINNAFAQVLRNPKIREKLINMGSQPDQQRNLYETQLFFEKQIDQYRSLARSIQ
jgi:tripartite-type tricarboxylate transporter receptor subunit TctC